MSRIVYPGFFALLEMLRQKQQREQAPGRSFSYWDIISHQKEAGGHYDAC